MLEYEEENKRRKVEKGWKGSAMMMRPRERETERGTVTHCLAIKRPQPQ